MISGDYIERMINVPNLPSCYTWQNLVATPVPAEFTYRDVEKYLREYVRSVLSLRDGTVTGDQIILSPKVNTIHTATPRKADGNITVNGVTVFIFEVESNWSWYTTTLKLAIHLSQMLASLRNRSRNGVSLSASVHSLSGFYFPNNKKECVVEVSVNWDDRKLRFVESHTMIRTVAEVECRLKSVYQQNKSLWENSSLGLTEFSYPVTPQYLTTNFTADAKQVGSGQSVVIVCEDDCFVYKYPMISSEGRNILFLRGKRLNQIGFPLTEMKSINAATTFLKYEKYIDIPPVSIIKEHAVWFVRSLVKAVESLHVESIAHLDIRLENICMKDDQIVLIDLDRSASTQYEAVLFQNKYPNSVNYEPPNDQSWTCENLDWKQVGLLLSGVFPRPHSSTPGFLSDLIDNGEIYIHPNYLFTCNSFLIGKLDPQKFQDWCAMMMDGSY